jgi:hypothetical protein
VGRVCRKGDVVRATLIIVAIALSAFALVQSGFIRRPIAKADMLPFSSFDARWRYNANQLEKARPDALHSNQVSKQKGN